MAPIMSLMVQKMLGHRALDVNKLVIDYIINILTDEDFNFGVDGDGAFEAIRDFC